VRLPLIEVEVSIASFGRLQVERPTKLRRPLYGVSTARPTSLPLRRSSSAALASSLRQDGKGSFPFWQW
jgi:hypothetical protein